MLQVEVQNIKKSNFDAENGIKMFFDVELKQEDGSSIAKINGFRLVNKNGKLFIGYPSRTSMNKEGKSVHYPTFVPDKKISETILSAAEYIFKTQGK